MAKDISTKRKYDSSRRKAQSRETQTQITESARELFIERGFAGTSIESIAKEAGVAAETVYSLFGNKRAILSRVVDVSIVGDGQPIPLLARAEIREVELETVQTRQVEMFAKRIQMIMARVAPLFEVMRSAAKTEPEIHAMLKKYLGGKMEGMGYFVDCLLANGPLRDGLSKLTATETLWTLTSAEVYNLLTIDRSWSAEEYENWLSQTLIRLLLP
ncbi:MAG: TetR/AcrR family transcriptional regulator [Anaerolineales bacterium]|nr:TetR/AcrR family transcriptional regulator [Anaerolineales bacterium]